MKTCGLTVLVAACVFASCNGANDPVCSKIVDAEIGWWKQREAMIKNTHLNEFDRICANFKYSVQSCTDSAKREEWILNGTITRAEANTPCANLGANHPTACVGNICNWYNVGKCNLQNTGGLCNWYSKDAANTYGVLYGCQRNRCNLGGQGNAKGVCAVSGVANFIECTWCSHMSGRGVGCQRQSLNSTSICAPVDPKHLEAAGISKFTIYRQKNNHRCQCTNATSLCALEIANNKGKYEPAY
uniref:Uncharacterized protein n=1 Tax=Mucochytrium quahogii TaxID=96639 RepID=A0A7S2RL60_9STRA|mmetsp:Transcript_44173/g.70632  ORF Transcript_44173/g.70632 Transcript_44173/m.70632 type:complete len:244 (+) Transcript_44173:47-778(+)